MPPRLRFVVDRNIPAAEEALRPLGDVTLLPSSRIDAAAVRDADVLWVRSTVRVDAALLDKSRVQLVATATIGTDHMDLPWLDARGVRWVSAPGSNAASVQLWWTAALATVAESRRVPLSSLRVGVVGVGHVGSKVEAVAAALGCRVTRCDPPRARAEGPTGFVPLADLVRASDVVTLHVPLTREGPDATVHLLDAARLDEVPDGAFIMNCSRGAALDSTALLAARERKQLTLMLDVFEGEPAVPPALVDAAALATPHIAGHSIDGKLNGTRMIYAATCLHLGAKPTFTFARSLPAPPVRTLAVQTRDLSDGGVVLKVLRRFYRIEEDDAAMRKIARLPDAERGEAFRAYRAAYPVHREVVDLRVELFPPRPRVAAALRALGATVVDPATMP